MASMYEDILMACFNDRNKQEKITEARNYKNSKNRLYEDEELNDVENNEENADAIEELDNETGFFSDSDDNLDDADDKKDDKEDEERELVVTTFVPEDKKDINSGDFIYQCQCCGTGIISEEPLDDGKACPSCGKVNVDDEGNESCLLLKGKVGEIEDVEDETDEENIDENADEAFSDEDIFDEEGEESTEAGEENAPEEENTDEEKANESYRKFMRNKTFKERENMNNRSYRDNRSMASRRVEGRNTASRIMLDESTFNPFLKKFVNDNYSNVASFRLVDAKKNGRNLSLECKLTFKSGTTKNVKLISENFVPVNGEFKFTARENGAFKVESRNRAPFVFTASMRNGVIRCEGLKYNYDTTMGNKKYNVYGSLVKESRNRRG